MTRNPPLLSPDEVDDFIIVRAVAFANKIQRMMLRSVLRQEDMPLLEWRILYSLARFGDCHLGQITQNNSMDPAHGSRAASALEAKGLIARRDDPTSRRRRLMSLTDAGQATFYRIWPRARDLVAAVTDGFDPDEFEQLKHLLDKANAIAQPQFEACLSDKDTREPDNTEAA
ncbi:MAG: MarR family winged helix-turn-helix transcriptional regulator [Pseudomonadota bacterium]